jgi:phosphatidylethanolamine-binding protein (PEBP) family uncharacterized protein
MNTQQVTLFPYRLLKGRLARATGFLSVAGLLAGCLFSAAFPSAVRAASETSSPQRAKSSPRRVDAATKARLAQDYGRLPMSFEPNQGQTDAQVKFLSRGRGYQLFLTQGEAVLSLRKPSAAPDMLRMHVIGADAKAQIEGQERLPGISNYFIGRDPSQWHAQIPNYRQVALKQVYPGIDLVFYGQERQLEYDFVVAPGADPKRIGLAMDLGTTTGHSPRIDANGDLVVALAGGEVRFHRPEVYQLSANSGDRTQVEGRYVLRASKLETGNSKVGNPKSVIPNPKWEVGFEIASYDATRPLIIDPVLSYSTYLGGSNIDVANGIAVDSTGSVFIVGETDSSDFPTAHPLQLNAGGGSDFPDDAFVTKIDSQGTLVYSTYLGGKNREYGTGIAVDSFGNAYVTGTTLSPDFPSTIGAFDPTCGTDGKCNEVNGRLTSDAFVTKLNPEGSALVYSSFLGGAGNERGFAIAVDNNGNAYLTGQTDFTDFPVTPSAFDTTCGTDGLCNFNPTTGTQPDAFMTKVSATGSSLLYSTYLGGDAEDIGLGIAADNAGNAYVTGLTYSSVGFPLLNPFQPVYSGAGDAFLTKIDTNASGVASLAYSTYLGGNAIDQGNGIAVDGTGKAYVVGFTKSTTVPFPTTAGVLQPSCALNPQGGCDGDVFVSKFDPTLSGAASLLYSTLLGGKGADTGTGIALDTAGDAYVTGFTNSLDFPVLGGPTTTYSGGNTDAFVSKLNALGTTPLIYSSFLGGSDADSGNGIAVDTFGNAFVAGQTCSTNFPTKRPLQPNPGGACDAFVSKLVVGPDVELSPNNLDFGTQAKGTSSAPQTITITNIGEPASLLNITSVTISGVDSSDFAATNNCSSPLAADANCTVTVTFTPTSFGPKTAQVVIADNVAPNTHTVSLSGSGGTLGVSPITMVFGDQGVGTTSATKTVTVTNASTTAVTILAIDASGDFAQNNTCTSVINNILAAGQSCLINVTFAPTATGTRSGAITITDTDPTSPQAVSLTGNGTAPIAAVSPSTLSFGNQGGTGAPLAVTLTNNGNAALSINNISVTGSFTETHPTCGAALLAGASCQINVSFVPTTPGATTGLLSITDNASGNPQTVALSGTGVVPVVSLSPASLTFASQPVNTTSAAQTVVLSNTGTATLSIVTIAVTGVNSTEFTQSNNCGASVAVGANCAINVTFSPTAAGTRLAAVVVADNAASSPQSVALSGTAALAPWATVAPTSLSFPDTSVGITSAGQTITLSNSGSATLLISSIATTGDFTKSDHCGASVAAGANCVITVTFTPTASGNRYGTLTITDNAGNSPQSLPLAGNGLPAPIVTLSPTALTFVDQPTNTTSSTAQSVQLSNTGNATLTITSVTITGTNGGDFALVSNTCGGTIPAGGPACTISVTFTPTAAGGRTAAITIVDNAPNTPQSVPLSGNGIQQPAVSLSPTSLTFPSQSVGTPSSALPVVLTNSGLGPLTITVPITITGTNATDFSQTSNCPVGPATLAPGLTCTINVVFTPSAAGTRVAALTITDNAPGSPQSVPLSGGAATVPGNYALTISPTAKTIFAGDTAAFTLTVTPVAGFTGQITLGCSGLPRQTVCSFNPISVPLDGQNPSTATVSIQTTARVQAPPASGPNGILPPASVRWLPWLFALLMLMTLAAAGRKRTILVLAAMMLIILMWAACGGGGTTVGVPNGTPIGGYVITVNGTSGSTTRTTTLTLNVN